jgi:hypothetical protein
MRWSAVLAAASVVIATSSVRAQQTEKVTAGAEYDVSGTARRWLGNGYRDIWSEPFEAPVLDLAREAGGLQPVRQVGQLQTFGLALRGADGNSYTFRSLRKEPERILPPEWRNSWPAKMLRDATSATHPAAAVILPVLADAAGVAHTQPRLVVMPDDPRLGAFRATFAHQLGTIEEYPTAASAGHPGFHGATAIISSAELWTRWLQSPEDRIDTRAFLRARILDLFVENYDRRRGQWRWMQSPGHPLWQPIPEDPDMVFVRHDGLVAASMRRRQPTLLAFSDEFPSNLEGPTRNAAEVDRWLLTDLEGAVFTQIAKELQAAWTDEVIDRAIAQMPKEWQKVDNGFLAQALRARRAALVTYVEHFYRYLARDVDVRLTDRDERVSIVSGEDGSTTVMATVNGATGPYYSRRFVPDETDEVRVYLQGGNDRVERSGRSGRIRLRLIADGGDKIVMSSDRTSEVWEDAGHVTGNRVNQEGPWTNPEPVKDAPWIEPRSYGSLSVWNPIAWIAPDVGFVLGAGLTHTVYGFRSEPFAQQHTLKAGWSFGAGSGKAQYDGLFNRPGSHLGYGLRTFVSGVEQINFFGFGNETPEQTDKSRYHSRQTVFSFAPALRYTPSSTLSLTVGPEFRHSRSGQRQGSILFEQQPYGTGDFNLVALRTGLQLDTRNVTKSNVLDVTSGVPAVEAAADLPPGHGFLALAAATITPAAGDVTDTYGAVDGSVAAYVGNTHVQLAARVGGTRLFGTYPWFDAASIGGRNDRGYHSHRFAGDASLYGNVEIRTYFGPPHFSSVFPVRFGLVGFVDSGRVWLEGESSNDWHPSGGGGLLMKPVGTDIVLRAAVAVGTEGPLLYIGSGFRF